MNVKYAGLFCFLLYWRGEKMLDIFTNREIAIFIWSFIICLAILLKKDIRIAFINVIKCIFNKHIIIPFSILILYSVIIALILSFKINILSFIKDIVLWVVFAGVPFAFTSINKKVDKKYFIKYAINNIKIIAILEFIVSNFTFKLIWELILIPFVTFIILLDAVAETKEEYNIVHRFLSKILTVIGLGILFFSFKQAINTYNEYSNTDLLISYIIPFIYSILFIPITYLMIVYSEYEKMFVRIENYKDISSKQKKEITKKIKFSLTKIQTFNSKYLYKLYNGISDNELKEILEQLK